MDQSQFSLDSGPEEDEYDDQAHLAMEADVYQYGHSVNAGPNLYANPELGLPGNSNVYEDDSVLDMEEDSGMPHGEARTRFSVCDMPGFQESLMGEGIGGNPPSFKPKDLSLSGWVTYEAANLHDIRPVRAMCINIPVECFQFGATRFPHWQTPMQNSARACNIAALVGLMWAGTSKGILSGNHEELQRHQERMQEDQEDHKKAKPPGRVSRYMYMDTLDHSVSRPMFTMAYEELVSPDESKVVAIRVWKLVYDPRHSDSELHAKVMEENNAVLSHVGVAHVSNSQRSQRHMNEHKRTRALVGGATAKNVRLESHAGTQYLRVNTESMFLAMLDSYAGASAGCEGRPPIRRGDLDSGALNQKIERDPLEKWGGRCAICPEWVYGNPDAQAAGLVHLDGTPIEVHADCLKSYRDRDDHLFRPPPHARARLWFMGDANVNNPFDCALPRAIAGSVTPGEALLELYQAKDEKAKALEMGDPTLIQMFNSYLTGVNQYEEKQLREMQESVTTFDTSDVTDEERVSRHSSAHGNRGNDFDADYIVEQREVMKEIGWEGTRAFNLLVVPWVATTLDGLHSEEIALRSGSRKAELATASFTHVAFNTLRKERVAFEQHHVSVMQDLARWGFSKMSVAYMNRGESEAIPGGFRSIHDNTMRVINDQPNRTGCVGLSLGFETTDSDRSVLACLLQIMNELFTSDVRIAGRDSIIMLKLYLTCHEICDKVTFLEINYGEKGKGKSLRCEIMMKLLVEGWMTMSGESSDKAGKQGNSDSTNGRVLIYDEMIQDLTNRTGDSRIEDWKQKLTKRELVYNKVMTTKGKDGLETMKTYKTRTIHKTVHILCTNRGPGFTAGERDPDDSKSALIDRAMGTQVRDMGTVRCTEQELLENLAREDVRRRMTGFQIMSGQVHWLKLFLLEEPFFKPNFAHATSLWQEWDDGDDGLTKSYNLPEVAARRQIRRQNILETLCCMKAVAHVFFFKNTCWKYECNRVPKKTNQEEWETFEGPEWFEDKDGEPVRKPIECVPWDLCHLVECLPLLVPTMEEIHLAWSLGLESSIGTSAAGLNAMTAVIEAFGCKVGDLFRKEVSEPGNGVGETEDERFAKAREEMRKAVKSNREVLEEAKEGLKKQVLDKARSEQKALQKGGKTSGTARPNPSVEPALAAGLASDDGAANEAENEGAASDEQLAAARQARKEAEARSQQEKEDAYTPRPPVDAPLLGTPDTIMSDAQVLRMSQEFSKRRKARSTFRFNCSRSSLNGIMMDDASEIVEQAMKVDFSTKDVFRGPDVSLLETPEAERTQRQQGELAFEGACPLDDDWSDEKKQGYRKARACCFPGSSHCDRMLRFGHHVDVRRLKDFHAEYKTKHSGAEVTDAFLIEVYNEQFARDCPYCHVETDDSSIASEEQSGVKSKLPLHTSSVWPSVLEASFFYTAENMVQWTCNKPGFVFPTQASGTLGTKPTITYMPTGAGHTGAARHNTAWLTLSNRADEQMQFDTFEKFAYFMVNSTNVTTIQQFNFHKDGLKDLLWMLTQSDNKRRCIEEPNVPYKKSSGKAFCDAKVDTERRRDVDRLSAEAPGPDGGDAGDASLVLRPRGPQLPAKFATSKSSGLLEHVRRDPNAHVLDTPLQRGVDLLLHGGRLPSLAVLSSNKIKVCAPLKLFDQCVQLNVGTLIDHWNLLAESVLVCSQIPGLKNRQEPMCGNASPPDGLAAPAVKNKRKLTEQQLALEGHKTLPYSYDLIPMAISINAGKMLYNDCAPEQCKAFNEQYQEVLGCKVEPKHLPQLTLRFPGYAEENRQYISLPLPTTIPLGQNAHPVVEDGAESEMVDFEHVSRSLGRHATDVDVQNYLHRRRGATSMLGVKGDLFAYSTWLNFTCTSLVSRGMMTSDLDDPLRAQIADLPLCLSLRYAERLSAQGDPEFAFLNLQPATPGTYEAAMRRALHDKHSKSLKRIQPTGGVQSVAANVVANFASMGRRRAAARAPSRAGCSTDAMEE